MSDVYVAFVRDDQVYAESLAVALQGSGFNVSRSASVVEAVGECPAIVVLWSPAAARSKLFMDAADRAFRSGKMVLARMGSDPLPQIFAGVEAHSLTRWSGDPESPDIDAIVFHVDRLVSRARIGNGQQQDMRQVQTETRAATARGGVVHRFPNTSGTGRVEGAPPQAPMRAAPVTPPPMVQAPPSDPLPAAPPPASSDPLATEVSLWRRIQHSANPEDFYAYLERYGSAGAFAEIAEARIRALTPAASPAPPPAQIVPAPVARPVRRDLDRPPLLPSSSGALDPHPARSRYDTPAPPSEPVKSGGGVRGFIFLLLIGAMLGGGVYIYRQVTAGAGPDDRQTIESMTEARDNTGTGQPSFVESDAAPSEDVAVSELSAPPVRQQKGASVAAVREPPPSASRTPPASASEPSGAELYRQRQRTQQPASEETPAPVIRTIAPPPQVAARNPDADQLARDVASPPPAPALQPAASVRAAPVRPSWTTRPSAKDLANAYPPNAYDRRLSGRVVLDCLIMANLSLNCRVQSETPAGAGFGAAALRLASKFRSAPLLQDNRPAAGQRALVPMQFDPSSS